MEVLELLAVIGIALLVALFVRLGHVGTRVDRLIAEGRSALGGLPPSTAPGLDFDDDSKRIDPLQQISRPQSLSEMRAYYRGADGPRGWPLARSADANISAQAKK